ncbi:hypothetical protein Ciccas_011374 [Cichlidogyrus casuarinus]|uniref:Uncharacterized protein n=1 Tax=Cichlidogyrus casuarinus TaxID=1844966 RepID=A0ABD2PSN8_9PLAT
MEKRRLNALGFRNKIGQSCFKRVDASEEPVGVVASSDPPPVVAKRCNTLKRLQNPQPLDLPVPKKPKRHSVFAALNT